MSIALNWVCKHTVLRSAQACNVACPETLTLWLVGSAMVAASYS